MSIQISQILKHTFRCSDYLIRNGGDEFLVVMTETNLTRAERALDRLREQVKRWNAANAEFGAEGQSRG